MNQRMCATPVRRTSIRVWLLVVMVISAALTGWLAVSPAAGATRDFTDPADAPDLDIRAVRVEYAGWLEVTARHQGDVSIGQTYRYYLDTDRAKAGPEFYFEMHPNSDALFLRRIDGFADVTR